ncbi:MAG TPA: hypothetical protein PKZ72_08900, partial [Saprospiraceae bacterium]|nr:hypothetical protein [Saprospiraceae bacterium]
NVDFLKEYKNTMKNADVKIVYYSKHTLEMKKMNMIEPEDVIKAFNEEDVHIFSEKEELMHFINQQKMYNTVLLWMSSGNFDGLDVKNISKSFV